MKTVAYRSLPKTGTLPTASSGLEGVITEQTSDKKPYYCDGTTWVDLSASGGGTGIAYTPIKTSTFSASISTIVRVDSTSGAFTVTLPAAPTDGSVVGVFDVSNNCGTTAVLIAPSGGDTIEGDGSGLSINITGAYVPLVYNSGLSRWKIADTYANAYTSNSILLANLLSPFLLMGA